MSMNTLNPFVSETRSQSKRVDENGIQTPMRNRRKLGDSSNLFNNVVTPSNKNAQILISKTPGFGQSRGKKDTAVFSSIKKVPSISTSSCFMIEKELQLKPDNHFTDFLESNYDVCSRRPDSIPEETEASLKVMSPVHLAEISFLADSVESDETVFEIGTASENSKTTDPLDYSMEKEVFGSCDNGLEDWLTSDYDVDLCKEEPHVEPMSPVPNMSSFDREIDEFLASATKTDNTMDLNFIAPIPLEEDFFSSLMSETEKNLMDIDITELLNL